jgi:alkylhydroperoxidase/carboxymuconolactone decarboxylase family protein YurZ
MQLARLAPAPAPFGRLAFAGALGIIARSYPSIDGGSSMSKLPNFYARFRETYPEVAKAYEALGEAAREAGPLRPKEAAMVKLALACGAHIEGAIHSHVRRALEAGAKPEEIRHVALLAITTLGFPTAMKIRALIEDVLAPQP